MRRLPDAARCAFCFDIQGTSMADTAWQDSAADVHSHACPSSTGATPPWQGASGSGHERYPRASSTSDAPSAPTSGPLGTATDAAATTVSGHAARSDLISVLRGSPTHAAVPGTSTPLAQSGPTQSHTDRQTVSRAGPVGSGGVASSYAPFSVLTAPRNNQEAAGGQPSELYGMLRTECQAGDGRASRAGSAATSPTVAASSGATRRSGPRSRSSSFNTFGAFSNLPFESSAPEDQPRLESPSNTGL